VVCASLFAFFSWSALLELGESLSIGLIVAVLVLVLLVWAAWRFGWSRGFQVSLAAVAVGLLAAPVPALLAWYTGDPVEIVAPAGIYGAAPLDGAPDVYFVILDGYGRGDVLEQVYGFSNDVFIEELARRGFQVPERSHANYSSTASSVSSTLAMEYLVDPGTTPDYRFVQALHDVIGGANPVVRTLTNSGYHYSHIEGGWDGARCGPNVDTCYRASFLDEAMWTLVGRTPVAPIAENWFGHAFALNGLRSLEGLAEEAATERSAPRFVFGHVLLPHPPITVDASCTVRPEPQPGGPAVGARFLIGTPELDGRRAGYVEQVECVNDEILRFLDELDDDAVVFITGDHGPDSFGQMKLAPDDWTEADIRERLAVLSAYRLPSGCSSSVAEDQDLINGMRIVLGCLVEDELPAQPVHSYIFPLADGPPNPTTEVDIRILGG
jgi:hypothetical protein